MPNPVFIALIAAAFLLPSAAQAKMICTLIVDPVVGEVKVQQGDCETRVTPASTAKLLLAAIGYETGFLHSAYAPKLPFKQGYVDWRGDVWRQPTDPKRWLKYSVVWFSQVLAKELGQSTLEEYAKKFGYGNADFSGDPGKNNGLERAWIASSLKISPKEQVAFLSKLVTKTLPVAPDVFGKMDDTIESTQLGVDLTVSGKTGTAFPRRADGSFDRARAYGWFVGWIKKGNKTLVFARLDQDEKKLPLGGGNRAREIFLKSLEDQTMDFWH